MPQDLLSASHCRRMGTVLVWAALMGLFPLTAPAAETGARDRGLAGRWGVGLEGGVLKLVEGEWDYSTLDQFGGVHLERGIASQWTLSVAFRLGYVRPGAHFQGEEVGLSGTSSAPLYTAIRQPMLTLRHHFAPAAVVSPVLGLGFGLTSWRVLDKTGESVGWLPKGDPADGYDVDGEPTALEGSDFTIMLQLGLDVALTDALTANFGARYGVTQGNTKDNVGLSTYWGPEHVDANTGHGQAFVGLTWRFGGGDRDGDGIPDDRDQCPDEAEDRDGYNDTDGCPDPDNDGDGILDGDDACPNRAEDLDGFQDEDGCPEPDNDGDGINDGRDQCPDEAEDVDGWDDQDGCPDPDNDQDGVPDDLDQCPRTPADSKVDAHGCAVTVPTVSADVVFVPAPTGDQVLEGVNFVSGSAALEPASIAVLVELAGTLRAAPDLRIEIRGYTDAAGDAAANRDLSQRRADSVRASLIQLGIAADRLTAIGLGEEHPLGDNTTAEGRARNRRVEIHRH